MVVKEEVIYKPDDKLIESQKSRQSSFQSLKNCKKEILPKDGWFMYLTAVLANMVSFQAAIGVSWTSPVFIKLKGPDSPLNAPIGLIEISFIASSFNIGQIVGPVIYGYLADLIGRKKTLSLIIVPQSVGLLILAFATDVRLYYFARFLHGLGNGGCFTVLTTYLAEISQQHSRGKFGCSFTFFLSLGIFYSYPAGSYLSIKWFCLSCLFPSLIFFGLFPIFGPESPLYLLKNGDKHAAENVLMKLRGNRHVVEQELLSLKEFVENNDETKAQYSELFKNPLSRKALVIGCGIVIFQHLTGILPFLAFLHDFFKDASKHGPLSADVGTSVIALIKALIVFVTSAVIEKLGRKYLFYLSTAVTSASTASLALYFLLKDWYPDMMEPLWWFPLPSLTVFVIGFNLGIGPVGWAVISEIFPSNVRSVASSLVFTVCFIAGFALISVYYFIVQGIGLSGTFALFSSFGILTVLFVHFMVPETKGKSLAEIQEMLIHH